MSQAGSQGVTFQGEGTRPPVLSRAMQIIRWDRTAPTSAAWPGKSLVVGSGLVGRELGCSVSASLGKVHPSGKVLSVTMALQRVLLSPRGPPQGWRCPASPGLSSPCTDPPLLVHPSCPSALRRMSVSCASFRPLPLPLPLVTARPLVHFA